MDAPSEIHCTACHRAIPVADINVTEGVALCRACGRLFRLGELTDGQDLAAIDPRERVPGCSIRRSARETVLSARAFTVRGILIGLFSCAFWNGIVSVFVIGNLGQTIAALGGSVPEWLEPLRMNSKGPPSLGLAAFIWLFLTPFMTIGVLLFLNALHVAFGRVRLTIRGDACESFAGIGSIGRKQRFSAKDVTRVSVGETKYQQNGNSNPLIHVEADRPIRFGSALPGKRMRWLAAAIRAELMQRKGR
ncbi:MAG: hypothetical protein JNM94_13165 [Phycisphaerae bacterium]|nr:hypothetical protein [Phycisphaerae bacterium]